MKKVVYSLIAFFLVLSIGQPIFAEEKIWEDENTPLSFRIELLPWKEVDEILPNKTKFAIIDVETGLLFHVQRRAGSRHADVQPLTSEDTKIMKKIYNGKWSWNRKAILVLSGDKMIPASMAGMPHGAGVLKNDFRGHFCVHFFGSTTHRSNKVDPAHQLMVLKASGKLADYLQQAGIGEVLQAFTIAVNQQDETLFNVVSNGTHCKSCFQELVKNVSYLSIDLVNHDSNNDALFVKPLRARVQYWNEKNQKINEYINLFMHRATPYEQWVIDVNHFISVLQ